MRTVAVLASLASFAMRHVLLLKIPTIIRMLMSGSRSGTEVAVPLVSERTWGSNVEERAAKQFHVVGVIIVRISLSFLSGCAGFRKRQEE
jgi:hypothetical protein